MVPKTFSLDLRVLATISDGMSHRASGDGFGVSAASVNRWRALAEKNGAPFAKPHGDDRRSSRIEAEAELIHRLLRETPDMRLEAMRAAPAARGRSFGYGALCRFFGRHGITQINNLHASEQDRPDVLRRPRAWVEVQPDLDPTLLVFIDENEPCRAIDPDGHGEWRTAKTNMTRTHGRSRRGTRLRMGAPHGRSLPGSCLLGNPEYENHHTGPNPGQALHRRTDPARHDRAFVTLGPINCSAFEPVSRRF